MNEDAERLMRRAGIDTAFLLDIEKNSQVPAELILAIIQVESSGRQLAIRYEPKYPYLSKPKDWARAMGWTVRTEVALQRFSYGLMQIMLATARDMKCAVHPSHLFDPKCNVSWGAKYLNWLHRRYLNWDDVISAYNQGSPKRKMFSKKYRNQEYVDAVKDWWGILGG